MQITFELPDELVDSYLRFCNDVTGTNLHTATLTNAESIMIEKAFASEAVAEFQMRADDHDAFETYRMFGED